MPRSRFATAFSFLLTAGVLCFLWLPLISLYGAALWEILRANPTRFFEAFPIRPLPRILFWNTLLLSVSSAFLALILGAIVASVLVRRSRFQILAVVLCVLPLAIAPTLMATAFLAWTRLPPARAAASLAATSTLSINSIFIAAPVLALCFYPIAAFALSAARRAIPTDLMDAAQLFGNPIRAATGVLWPLLKPATFAALGLIATLSMWEMGASDLLDARTYSVQIYRDFSASQNISKAALDAIPMFVLGALCFLPFWRALRFYQVWENFQFAPHEDFSTSLRSQARFAAVEMTRISKRPKNTNPLAWVALLIFMASPIAAIAIFISQMKPASILFEIWVVNREEILNTIWAASATSLIILVLSTLLIASWREYSARTQRWILLGFLLPLLGAPIMVAVALLQFYNWPIFDWFFDSQNVVFISDFTSRYGLLIFGFLTRFLPLGVLWIYEASRRIPRRFEESATSCGASPFSVFREITIPLLLPSLIGLGAVLWTLCATELSLAVLLNSPGGQTLPVPIFNQMHIGATEQVAALSLTLVGLSAGVLLLPFVAAFGRRIFMNLNP